MSDTMTRHQMMAGGTSLVPLRACFSTWQNFYSLPEKFFGRKGKCSYSYRSEFISHHLTDSIVKDSVQPNTTYA